MSSEPYGALVESFIPDPCAKAVFRPETRWRLLALARGGSVEAPKGSQRRVSPQSTSPRPWVLVSQ
jgi:hypothetical protein